MKASSLTDMQLDALREISGIGAGHAATALSELVGRTVRLEVPTVEVIDIARMPYVLGGPEDIVGAVYARLDGEIEGGLLCMATPEAVRTVIGLLGGVPAEGEGAPNERLAGVVVEAMGHLISSYLLAISQMTGLVARAADTSWAYDMAGALLEAVVSGMGTRVDSAVFVRTAFIDAGRAIEVAFFFVPDPDSLGAILGRLGLASSS
jgi:chemotaxis protein CheC